MTEPLVLQNFAKTGDGFGTNMQDWLEQELDRIWRAVCPYNPCLVDPFANIRTGITLMQGQIADLTARVEALENP